MMMYVQDQGARPETLDNLAHLFPKEILDKFAMTSNADGGVLYSRHAFRAVKKGEPWGGPGEVAKTDHPAARIVLLFGVDTAAIIPESEFLELIKNVPGHPVSDPALIRD